MSIANFRIEVNQVRTGANGEREDSTELVPNQRCRPSGGLRDPDCRRANAC